MLRGGVSLGPGVPERLAGRPLADGQDECVRQGSDKLPVPIMVVVLVRLRGGEPVIMSRTVNVNPLLVLLSILVGTSIGGWLGGFLGGFRGCICFPSRAAAALQVIARELWLATEWQQPADGGGPTGPERPVGDKQASQAPRA